MAAMAGALDVTLEKPTAYRLGDGALPTAGDIERSVKVLLAGAAVSLGLVIATFLAARMLLGVWVE